MAAARSGLGAFSEGRIYKAVVKATQDSKELYLVTFHRTDDGRELEREKSRGRVVREELE